MTEIDHLESLGIISKTKYSEWATPIVPVVKHSGEIRLRGDYKVTVNKYIEKSEFPIPHIEDILANMGNCKFFSKFDIREAYMHMSVDEDTSKLLTINTPKGLYQVHRLMYGIANAPAEWQQCMESLFQEEGLQVFYDDIKISSPDAETHLARLKAFFLKCRENGIRLKEEKCEVLTNKISYLGFDIDAYGLHKTKEKIESIQKAKKPTNVTELKSLIGFVTYYSRFFKNMAEVLSPLYKLLEKNTEFKWSRECENAFAEIKREIGSPKILAHFNVKENLRLATDASSYGLGAVLSHVYKDGSERPIAFASRSLSKCEKRYSQIDKEALSIFWGVKKFFNYLYGRRFELVTDHRPLLTILAADSSAPSISTTRLLHYSLFLQGFDYKICFRKSEDHMNADFCSRFPCTTAKENMVDEPHVIQVQQISTLPITADEIAKETAKDLVMTALMRKLMGDESGVTSELTQYTIEKGCIMKGIRVYIPPKLQEIVLEELHHGHLGVVKMKGLARSYVYWPGIDKDIESKAKTCVKCLSRSKQQYTATIHPWEFPGGPWQRLHLDFAGPFASHYFLIIVDAYSKWLEVYPMKTITASATIKNLKQCFARFGLPVTCVSDNGTQFTSFEFEQFLRRNGIKHVFSAPYFPASNGQAERCVQTVKEALRTTMGDQSSVDEKLDDFLLKYRIAPHCTTGESPARLLMKRTLRSRLDLLIPNVSERVLKKQNRMVEQRVPKVASKGMEVGNKVIFRMYNHSDKWSAGTIVDKIGSVMYKISSENQYFIRHENQMRPCAVDSLGLKRDIELDPMIIKPTLLESPEQMDARNSGTDQKSSTQNEIPTVVDVPVRRSSRKRRPPKRFSPD